MKKSLLRLSQESGRLEELIPAYLEKLEDQKTILEDRVDEYDSKSSLTERQEEKRDELEWKASEIDDEIDLLERVLTSIQDIRFELIEYLSKSNIAPPDNVILTEDDLDSADLEQASVFGTAIKAVIATELTIAHLKE